MMQVGLFSIVSIFFGFIWIRVGLLFGCCGLGLSKLWNNFFCFEYGIWYMRLQRFYLICWIMMNYAVVFGQFSVHGSYAWTNGYMWFLCYWFLIKTYRTAAQLSLLQLVNTGFDIDRKE